MQLDFIVGTVPLFGNALACGNLFTFSHQQAPIITIGASISFAVLDNQQVAVTDDAAVTVYHLSVRDRIYGNV